MKLVKEVIWSDQELNIGSSIFYTFKLLQTINDKHVCKAYINLIVLDKLKVK